MNGLQQAFDAGFDAVKAYIDREFDDFERRLLALERRGVERGERGEAGPAGPAGASVTIDDVASVISAEVQRAVSALPAAKNGENGKDGSSVTVDDVAPLLTDLVSQAVAAIPVPKDGEPGRDAPAPSDEQIAGAVARHLETNPPAAGKDGASVSLDDVAPIIRSAVEDAVASLPPAKDGRDGAAGKDAEPITIEAIRAAVLGAPEAIKAALADYLADHPVPAGKDGVGLAGGLLDREGHLVLTLTNGETRDIGLVCGRDGRNGEPGMNGTNGRDGFSLKNFDAELQEDGRTVVLKFEDDTDVSFTVELGFPVMIYRGVFKEGQAYERGDTVTWAGSLWHCDEPTVDRPGEGSKAWTLAAKRGRDGKEPVKV